ncbi:hypothetical protein FQN52_000997 [Onygenales sp. PD_12]|nr:hypothetical protein FQN52_000997 [Onygenales sp. PD_12]
MSNFRNWADGPFELVPSPKFKGLTDEKYRAANEMSISHNVYIRGLNAIYLQAEHVLEQSDVRDFLLFCKIWVEILDHHHDLEEAIFFTQIEEKTGNKGLMATNIEQHRIFHEGLESFIEYLNSAEKDLRMYDGKALKGYIDGFASALVTHLHDEIPTLITLADEHDKDGTIGKKAFADFEKELIRRSWWTRHHPFVFGCVDVSFEDGVNADWPPVPFFIPYAVSFVFYRKLQGVWRFLPSDFYGRRRDLAFGPSQS